MLDNCSYNKIKLMHNLSDIVWFIEKFCEQDSKISGHRDCQQAIEALEADLEKHISLLREITCKKI
jgi:hypothetical protein